MPSRPWPGASWAILVKNSPASAFTRAARKLEQAAEQLDPLTALLQGEGLCTLLQYAARCDGQDLPAIDDDDLPTTSFTALLKEARLATREQEERTC
jgi:hypothetical protein